MTADANEVERACCINYVSPDVMGFTREVNDWIAAFTRRHRDRLNDAGGSPFEVRLDVAGQLLVRGARR